MLEWLVTTGQVGLKLLPASESSGLVKRQIVEPHFQSIPFWSSWVESNNLHFYLVLTNADAGGPETTLRTLGLRKVFVCLKAPSLAHFQ